MASVFRSMGLPWTLLSCVSFFVTLSVTPTASTAQTTEVCRSKSRLFERRHFELHSCAWCYQYLGRMNDIKAHPIQPYLFVLTNRTALPARTILVPDISNASAVKRVCSTLSKPNCEGWQECCQAARDCCQRQLLADPQPNGTCSRNWDGFSCWDDTPSGTTELVRCPGFLQYASFSGYAQKTCWENGTWFSHHHEGPNGTRGTWQEWTDYTTCINKQRMLTSLYLALGCNTISVIFLLPALIIFLAYRSLRRQHRIRLHVNFFTALLFSNIMSIMWDFIVTHDRITDDSDSGTTPVLFSNGVGCKLLAFLRLYFKSNTYVWMFCEGFYLHRLISNAFRPPKSLVFFYGSGWGVPLFYCMLYVILRGVYANDSCWANSFGHLEWIVYCPNLLCLVINLFFLCNILRVLLTQLQTHPNEPSNFRRALKATFVLIPLFGVQLFVTIYRVPAGQAGGPEYEQFTVFVNNSQGFFVALIFCFCNGEVIAQMKRTCTRRNLLRAGTEISSRGVTMGTSLHPRDDDNEGGGGGTNGILLHRNGGQGHRGSKSAVVNNSCASGNDGNRDGKRGSEKYSYIPMKTLTSGGGGGGGGDVRSPV